MGLPLYIFIIGVVTISIISISWFISNDKEYLNDFEQQAEFLTSKNEYEKAIFYYDKILLNDPDNTFALKGKELVTQKMLEKSIEYKSAQQDTQISHSKSLTESFELDSTLKINEQINNAFEASFIYSDLQYAPESSITREIIEANKLFEEERYDEALLLYETVLTSNPSNLYALNGKGGTLLSLKQFDASIATFDTTLQFYPNNVNALNGKAYAYYLKAFSMVLPGLFYDSVHVYQKSLEIDPKNMNALIGIASTYAALERYDEAIHYYEKALSVDPDHKNANNALFNLWIKLGNNEVKFFYFDSAITFFDKVLEIDPNNLNALLAKAGAYTEWGKSKEKHYTTAENMYASILEIYPNNTQALVGIGYVLNEQLEFERALIYYEKALEIDPDYPNAQRGKSLALRSMDRN